MKTARKKLDEPYLTVAQIAEKLGWTPRKFEALIDRTPHDQRPPLYQENPGAKRHYKESEVAAWMDARMRVEPGNGKRRK